MSSSGLPGLDAEPIMGRAVADPDAEAKAAARELVDEGRGLGEVEGCRAYMLAMLLPNGISRVLSAIASQSPRPSPRLGQ